MPWLSIDIAPKEYMNVLMAHALLETNNMQM